MSKTFLLGGGTFTAPDQIGAGIRARAMQITSDIADERNIEGNPTLLEAAQNYSLISAIQSILNDTKKKPETATVEIKRLILSKKEIDISSWVIRRFWYEYSLRFLETILTPEQGSPSVKEAYDSATDAEVQAVMDFFNASASGKTKSANGKINAGASSKRTAPEKP